MHKDILLSDRQERILKFIKKFVQSAGYPPSVREIGQAVGLKSTSTVHAHLRKLEQYGLINRAASKPRAIDAFTENPASNSTPIPLVGVVTAGVPILATQNIEGVYSFPQELVGSADDGVFMLRVQGESMINAGIFDQDYILVRKQSSAKNNDIVVALVDDDTATVKRFFKEKSAVRLQPENDAMQPLYPEQVSILGKVIGVYRKL